jgi:hypothetical protein
VSLKLSGPNLLAMTKSTISIKISEIVGNDDLSVRAIRLYLIDQTRLSPQRVRSPLGILLCVFLAFSVFAWGTGYKLSLYKADQHREPAKVCTRGSDAARSSVDHAATGCKVWPSSVLLSLISVPSRTETYSFIDSGFFETAEDLSPHRSRPVLHLRPPPVEVRSLD